MPTRLVTAATHLVLVVALVLLAPRALAQCSAWSPGFARPGLGIATSRVAYDAGAGEQLYVTAPTGLADVERWTGVSWEPVYTCGPSAVPRTLASGVVNGVNQLFLAEHRLGSNAVLAWDGTTWTNIGTATGGTFNAGIIERMKVLDDGTGPALYIAGEFLAVDGIAATRIAKWNGTSWSSLGTLPFFHTASLTIHDDGNGPRLHVGAGSSNFLSYAVAVWDGSTWSQVGTLAPWCFDLVSWDSGSGPRLYAAAPSGFAWWDGATWTQPIGPIVRSYNAVLADLGAGPRIFVAGRFTSAGGVPCNNVASFDGTTFAPLAGGVLASAEGYTNNPNVVAVNEPAGARIYVVGGGLWSADGLATDALGIWDGAAWSVLGRGFTDEVVSVAACDLGAGAELFAVGAFGIAGGAPNPAGIQNPVRMVARWNGAQWSGVPNTLTFPQAVSGATFGGTTKLYVAGRFVDAPYFGIAEYDGAAWAPLGGGIGGEGYALLEHDDGSGARLFVGGNFPLGGAAPGNRIAAWNGSAWSNLAGGMNDIVAALARHDAGAGTQLFAAGSFTTAGGTSANRIARWDGGAWSALGTGLGNGGVNALASFAGALYVGGTFTDAGGVTVSYLARWDGSAWSDVPGGGANGAVLALHVHDDGRGPALYVGGGFSAIGGITAYNLARFDGASWEAVDGGIDGVVRTFASIDDDGDGDDDLFAGGKFLRTATVASGNIARLEGCPHYTSFCFGDGALTDHTTPCPCGNDGAPGHGCASGANAGGALLAASGATQTDNVVLAGSGFPSTAYGLYLQHDAPDDRVFHDGVLCAGGNLLRLRNRNASGGASQFPDPAFAQDATLTLSQRGFVTPGSGVLRYYSVFYRSPAATFCPPATANVTNGVRVIW